MLLLIIRSVMVLILLFIIPVAAMLLYTIHVAIVLSSVAKLVGLWISLDRRFRVSKSDGVLTFDHRLLNTVVKYPN